MLFQVQVATAEGECLGIYHDAGTRSASQRNLEAYFPSLYPQQLALWLLTQMAVAKATEIDEVMTATAALSTRASLACSIPLSAHVFSAPEKMPA